VSYQVLARKWRPKTFKEVIGQPHVLTALENGLLQDRMHHAYLFSGTRGVGKTTIARILAKSLNCETGVTATPCGECSNCQAIDQGRFVDLLEIDAASRTKVDDTRELLDNVQYKPAQGRYKVYLIDEVHMLSKHSFNALLKTLEEPPEYVKFLLATTDPQKLPITVLSRCLQFHLKAILPEQIEQQLSAILTHEKATFEVPALRVIAKAADGSMRDALSLTDQALAFGAGHIQYAAVLKMLGTIDQSHLHYLLHFIASGNSKKVFEKIQEFVHLGADFSALHQELANLCHQIALMQLNINPNVTKKSTVQLLAERLTPEEVQLFYQIALQGFKDYPYAPNGKIALEMTVMRLLAFKPANYIDIDESMIAHLNQAENDLTVLSEPTIEKDSKAILSTPVLIKPINDTSLANQPVVNEATEQQVVESRVITPAVEVLDKTTPIVEHNESTPTTEKQQNYPDVNAAQHEPELHVHDDQAYNPATAEPLASEQAPVTPQIPGANFNLAATTNSRNMLRSHRLKREELKKNNAATEQTTIDKNDRFVASKTPPSVVKTAQPMVNNTPDKIIKPSAIDPTVKPIVEAKGIEHNNQQSIQRSDADAVEHEQDLPPLSSYQDQPYHLNDEEYDYPDYDYFNEGSHTTSDNNFATSEELEVVDAVKPVADGYQSTQVERTYNDQARELLTPTEPAVSPQHKLVDDYFASSNTAPVKDTETENLANETTLPVTVNLQAVAHGQAMSYLDEAVNSVEQDISSLSSNHQTPQHEQPVSSPNRSEATINEEVRVTKTAPVNFDISTLNTGDNGATEVLLIKDDNFPRPEIDIPGFVEDKMTDPWFLAIKAMQLSGFEKLLAKNCVMQQQAQEIMLTLHESQAHLLNNQTLCDGLKDILRQYYGQQYVISIEVGEVKDSHTPMALEKIVYQQYLTNAQASIENDAIVQTFVSDYAAKVYENSIIPL
jgi:DNA polymerase-3 subunit gamma/tau